MEALNLVEVVLNNDAEAEDSSSFHTPLAKSSPIKGLDESVTITVTRTPGRPLVKETPERRTGKPASFALMSNIRNGVKNADTPRPRAIPREELICKACDRVFKYKAAFIRHEAQCGLPIALRIERNAILEAKKAERAALVAAAAAEAAVAEAERRKAVEKQRELRCPACLKQFPDEVSYKSHDLEACAAERATYTFVCSVCQARFKYKNHMRRHEDSHNNVRRYNCDVCTTAFLRPDHLKRHMMRMHGIVQMPVQAPPKAPPMQCPVCDKILSRRDHLLRHMRNVHHANMDGSRKSSKLDDHIWSPEETKAVDSMETDGSQSAGEDDKSENLSLTSHDGLRIDESYEEIKQECESSDAESGSMREENGSSPGMDARDCSANQFCQPQLKCNLDDAEDNNLNQNESSESIKVLPHLINKESDEIDGKPVANFSGSVKKPLGDSSSRPPSQFTFKSHGQGYKGKGEFTIKTGSKNASDGNQNVVPNGHVSRGAGEDWISDLVNLSGW